MSTSRASLYGMCSIVLEMYFFFQQFCTHLQLQVLPHNKWLMIVDLLAARRQLNSLIFGFVKCGVFFPPHGLKYILATGLTIRTNVFK